MITLFEGSDELNVEVLFCHFQSKYVHYCKACILQLVFRFYQFGFEALEVGLCTQHLVVRDEPGQIPFFCHAKSVLLEGKGHRLHIE